jgi:membrane-associated protein
VIGLVDLLLHVDRHLLIATQTYGAWIYVLLFAIVFAETGLIVTPFLPGDSLLFAAGALAATGAMDVRVVILLLVVAAIAGDAVNYSAGRVAGVRAIELSSAGAKWARWVNPESVTRAQRFLAAHGGKAVVLARFVPVVRTFVPFVAGAVQMSYPAFAFYNVTGGAVWVGLCVGAGYLFGNVPLVKDHFTLVAVAIVIVSLMPLLFEYARHRRPSNA